MNPEESSATITGTRSLIAFWILGLTNNYGYVVMLSAAHDIISKFTHEHAHESKFDSNPRGCNHMSTGLILLADIVPCLATKIIMPFLPLWINLRMVMVVLLSIASFMMVATAANENIAISGVCLMAVSSGLGEVSMIPYMSFYQEKDVILLWSSGTGAAGFFGALFYSLPTSLGTTPETLLLTLNIVPVLQAFSFFILLESPRNPNERQENTPGMTVAEKLKYIPYLYYYMIPIGLVYLFEYTINQGLHELVNFDDTFLTHEEQYRWYQTLYQTGVFISRSSLKCYHVKKLPWLAILQGINVIFFIFQAIFAFVPFLVIVMVIILWEGLLGGTSYVNTLHNINVDIVEDKREFSMGIVTLADATGVSLAGLIAIPLHNAICSLPKY